MNPRITLIAQTGPLMGQEFTFTRRVWWVVGRSSDCQLQLPGDDFRTLTVSRRHCLLDIDPPFARVRDLGSLNGTFVNERNIGQRDKVALPQETELHDGDRLVVGNSQFLIQVQDSSDEEAIETSPELLEPFPADEANRPVDARYAVCG